MLCFVCLEGGRKLLASFCFLISLQLIFGRTINMIKECLNFRKIRIQEQNMKESRWCVRKKYKNVWKWELLDSQKVWGSTGCCGTTSKPCWGCVLVLAELDDLKGIFQPKWFHDPLKPALLQAPLTYWPAGATLPFFFFWSSIILWPC